MQSLPHFSRAAEFVVLSASTSEGNLMKRTELNRRDFARLTAAAFGGMIAGAAVGCGEAQKKESAPAAKKDAHDGEGKKSTPGDAAKDAGGEAESVMLSGKNVCRGLNTCKNHKGGDNACAGQGACALAAAHGCHAENECKGQGGCGEHPGQNACKGKGECAVPLHAGTWEKARAAFEKAMADAGKSFGPAPAEKK